MKDIFSAEETEILFSLDLSDEELSSVSDFKNRISWEKKKTSLYGDETSGKVIKILDCILEETTEEKLSFLKEKILEEKILLLFEQA